MERVSTPLSLEIIMPSFITHRAIENIIVSLDEGVRKVNFDFFVKTLGKVGYRLTDRSESNVKKYFSQITNSENVTFEVAVLKFSAADLIKFKAQYAISPGKFPEKVKYLRFQNCRDGKKTKIWYREDCHPHEWIEVI